MLKSVMAYHRHFGSSQAERGRIGCMKPAAIWLWTGLLRETRAGANLQRTLPARLSMRMTCSPVFLWSRDTFIIAICSTHFFAQGQGSLWQLVQMNMTSIKTFYNVKYVFNHWCMLGNVSNLQIIFSAPCSHPCT